MDNQAWRMRQPFSRSYSELIPSVCFSVAVAFPAAGMAAEEDKNVSHFDTVVVTASKTEQRLGDVAGSVKVVDEEQIKNKMPSSVADLFKYTPSVTVGGTGSRGDSSINIRGISGNRVLVAVDGVKQPKELLFGPLQSSRHFIDPVTLKQVEVVPGPASSLYGSDALGGVVSYTTKDPDDIFQKEGNGVGGELSAAYDGADNGFRKSVSVAGRKDSVESMLIVTHRTGDETENGGEVGGAGSSRELADPQDTEDVSVLGKVNIDLGGGKTLKLTGEHVESDVNTEQLSSSARYSRYDDQEEKNRISAELLVENDTALFDEMSAKLDWQKAKTDQLWSYSYGRPSSYEGFYDEENTALTLAFEKSLSSGSVEHKLNYGLSFEQQDYAQRKDSSSSGIARSMPKSEMKSVAAYLQDQIDVTDALTVTPGIRFDKYTISPQPDADYLAEGNVDPDPGENSESQTSVKLGATYDLNDQNSVFAQFAQGFKAPDMNQLYVNSIRPYRITLANPDLEAESSDSFELGYRFDGNRSNVEVTAFHNDYDKFIETVTISPPSEYLPRVQNQNLAGVNIKGLEVSAEHEVTDNISVKGAVAYAKGTYEKDGTTQPLDSVSPLHGTFGVAYEANDKRWGGEVLLTAAKGKKDGDVESASTFKPGGYGIVDVTAYRKLGKNVRLDAGIYNVADTQYWEWETARDLSTSNAGLARFSEPGRHAKVGLTWAF